MKKHKDYNKKYVGKLLNINKALIVVGFILLVLVIYFLINIYSRAKLSKPEIVTPAEETIIEPISGEIKEIDKVDFENIMIEAVKRANKEIYEELFEKFIEDYGREEIEEKIEAYNSRIKNVYISKFNSILEVDYDYKLWDSTDSVLLRKY